MNAKSSSSAVLQGSPLTGALKKAIATTFDIRELKGVVVALANCPDEGFQGFRDECVRRLGPATSPFFAEYSDESLLMFREQLRMLWKPPRTPADVPAGARTMIEPYNSPGPSEGMMPLWAAAIDGTKLPRDEPHEVGTLQEEVLNFWLRMAMRYTQPHRTGRSQQTSWIVVWNKKRRGLVPNGTSLPTILVNSILLSADRLRYCRNKACAKPYFIAVRRDQLYCSIPCAAPAKKAAKRKWWRREHAHDRLPSLALKGGD